MFQGYAQKKHLLQNNQKRRLKLVMFYKKDEVSGNLVTVRIKTSKKRTK